MTEYEIFAAAIKLSGAPRVAFLDAACGMDGPFRQQVDALLNAHDESGGLLPRQTDRDLEVTQVQSTPIKPGTTIASRYKLVEAIGEGGMGTVWMAEQKEPVKRKVAIKLVKPGMDSPQVLARFEAERQALALMDHPNIAKVFDGGITEQGRSYFVMEFVRGVPLTEYCDQARLSVKQRLELFVPICQAVQHAHQKGIIHRDLKPSNLLICLYDGKPVPKVIDFGLAKAMHQSLTEQTLHTVFGMMVGTPLYMSPEQAEHNNLDVDTRTDIYSLGVILYELLTGSTPLERQQLKDAAYNEILRLIKEVEPPKPSTRLCGSGSLPTIAAQRSIDPNHLRKSLTGDLDWIVMKALDKERSRRYETAIGLSRDVERFLNDEAVEASPPSPIYRLRKLLRRHRSAIGTATAIAALLIGGTSISVWQAVRATNAEGDALDSEARAVEALRLVTQERDAKNAALAAESTQRELAEKQFVAGMLRPIGFGESPNQGELQGFVDWAALPNSRLKLRVLEVAFENPETAIRLARRSERTVQAAIGLSPLRRARALEFLSTQQRQSQAEGQLRVAACWLAMELGSADLPALAETIAWLGGPNTNASIMHDDFGEFIAAMTRQRDILSPENVSLGGNALLALLENSPDARQREITGKGMAALVPRLSQEDVTRAWEALVALLEKPMDIYPLPAVEQSLAALAPRLSPAQSSRAADRLIALLENSTDPFVRVAAGKGLAGVSPQLPPEQATRYWDAMFHILKKSTDAPVRLAASDVLAALAPRLSLEQVTRAVHTLISVLDNPVEYDAKLVVVGLGRLAPRLGHEHAARGWDALVALLEKSTSYDVQQAVGDELVELAPWLSSEQVIQGWNALLALQEKSTDINTGNVVARGLIALARRMNPEQATRGMDSLIPLLETSTDREVLGTAMRGLLPLAPQLSPESATRGWESLVVHLEKATDVDVLMMVGLVLRDLAPRLSASRVIRDGDSLLAMLEQGRFPQIRLAASNGLVGLAPRLSPEQVTRTGDALIVAVNNPTDYDARDAAEVLGLLASRLSKEQVARAWDDILTLLEKSNDRSVRDASGTALAALVPQISPDQLTRGRESLEALLKKGLGTYSNRALEALVVRLNPEQQVFAAEVLLTTLSRSSSGDLGESLAVIIRQLESASRDRFSLATLTILLNQEVSFRDAYQARAYSYNHFKPVIHAISNPKLLAELFAHPGCRGEQREYMLQRFEELVLDDGRPVLLRPNDAKDPEPADSSVSARRSRRFRNLNDAAIWIQKEWPDFDLESCDPTIWHDGNRQL